MQQGFCKSLAGISTFLILAGCAGGGGGTPGQSTSELTDLISEVPVVGQFLADCSGAGTATIREFVVADPFPAPPAEVVTAGEILAAGDPGLLPVVGGLLETAGTELESLGAGQALSMLPAGGLAADLPVIGSAPVSCSSVALPEGSLPEPTDAIGAVPVFDELGDPIGVVVVTTGLDGPVKMQLPIDEPTLPEPFPAAISSVLMLLDIFNN